MYQVLIDIHNFKQLLKVSPGPVSMMASELQTKAKLFGASHYEITQGRLILGFPIHRPGDSVFVIDSVFSIRQYLLDHQTDIAGFTIIIESGSGGMDSERLLRQLLVCATEDESLWLGPAAAETLAPYVRLEPHHGIWRVAGRAENLTPDLDISTTLFDDFLPQAACQQFLLAASADPGSSPIFAAVTSDSGDAAGDLVNVTINRIIGKESENKFVWVIGQNDLDPTPVALTRTLFPQLSAVLVEMFEPMELEQWQRVNRFLFQNAVSTISGVPFTSVSPEYPEQLFNQAWNLYLTALTRLSVKNNHAFFIHIENHHLLSPHGQQVLGETAKHCAAIEGARVVVVYSGSQLDELPDHANQCQVFPLPLLSWDDLAPHQVRLDSLSPGLDFTRNLDLFSRRHAACLRFLNHRAQQQSDQVQRMIDLSQDKRSRPVERTIVKLVIASCDDLLQEVYYALVITYGLMPLSMLFDFLGFMSIERIRHPAIIQDLFSHGLIRHEELVIPSFPHCADEISELLGERTLEIQSRLDNFLSLRLKERRLPFKQDLFSLASDLAEPDNFYEICFRYSQELLNAGLLDQSDLVLDCASTRVRQEGTSLQKKRLNYAINYLNCRSLLLRNRGADLQTATSQLNGLTELPEAPITAYITLQKARIHFFQGEIEQAQREIKQAVMHFQEIGDFTGLADSQILFGQILLAKERMIEARDYFILARNNATRTASIYQDIMAGMYDIVVVFLLGYHSRTLEALKDIQGILELARQNGFFSQVCFMEFLRGRVWFELGAYAQARMAFADALALCYAYPNPAATTLAQRWIARCDLFNGESEQAEATLAAMDNHRETLLFRAEAFLVRERFGEALDLLENLLARPRPPRVMHPERLVWDDGYANLEGKVMPLANHQDAIGNLAICYRAYCLSRLDRRTDGVESLFSFTRDKKRSTQDPNNHVYFMLYGMTLGKTHGESGDDCATILGKAVKYLQERSSRIEEPTHKQSFLKASYWNRRLLQEAKSYNLA